jgi:hypothetical protein
VVGASQNLNQSLGELGFRRFWSDDPFVSLEEIRIACYSTIPCPHQGESRQKILNGARIGLIGHTGLQRTEWLISPGSTKLLVRVVVRKGSALIAEQSTAIRALRPVIFADVLVTFRAVTILRHRNLLGREVVPSGTTLDRSISVIKRPRWADIHLVQGQVDLAVVTA